MACCTWERPRWRRRCLQASPSGARWAGPSSAALCAQPELETAAKRLRVPFPEAEMRRARRRRAAHAGGRVPGHGRARRPVGGHDRRMPRGAGASSTARWRRYLQSQHAAWHVVGRVHFHLAENRADPAAPFAFLATYSTRLSSRGRPQHRPLGEAIREYAGAGNRPRSWPCSSPCSARRRGVRFCASWWTRATSTSLSPCRRRKRTGSCRTSRLRGIGRGGACPRLVGSEAPTPASGPGDRRRRARPEASARTRCSSSTCR